MGFSISSNTGRLLENLVFLALHQQNTEIYYFTTPSGDEVDFYLPEKRQLIQVSPNLFNPPIREREVRTLSEALQAVQVESALILSDENENDFKISGVPVEIRSVSQWLITQ